MRWIDFFWGRVLDMIILLIEGMICVFCVGRVERALKKVSGVVEVS